MNIKSISLISFISTLACASAANASVIADFYIGGMAGAGGHTMFSDHKNETDSSSVFGGIVGMDLPIFRIEGEYNYFNSQKLDTNAAMVNLYAKIPATVILPYIGGGFGTVFGGEYTITNGALKTEYHVESTAAYQAMLGATIDILALPLKFDVEGRVLYAPDIYTVPNTQISPDLLEYNVRVKARFIF